MTDVAANDTPLTWLRDWDAALDQSRTTRRPILIDVSKDP
jgi:hypothetical protein